MDPGTLLASGRAADVYDQGDGTVLRRYRTDHDVVDEGRLMVWLAEQGYPVPEVHSAGGRDMVMTRIEGPTMFEDLAARPWKLIHHARSLARLQRRLNLVRAPDWLGTRPGMPAGEMVVHLDLHPMNVMITVDGPVVIDWTNASRGPASFDAAMTSVLMSTAELSERWERAAVRLFAFAFELSRGRGDTRAAIPAAARYRLADPNITDVERTRLQRLVVG